ncbi:hypothetical protein D4764_20G0009810 [Takifugu flavidus]|uniref:ribonuclease H n=1 Tax=Takifugu flavidus TaxID=433684 RepID=A0A5C6NJZ9_9TELE|nr:hypothetical protein D4764_20G0009810 [Takifugu flavidus]
MGKTGQYASPPPPPPSLYPSLQNDWSANAGQSTSLETTYPPSANYPPPYIPSPGLPNPPPPHTPQRAPSPLLPPPPTSEEMQQLSTSQPQPAVHGLSPDGTFSPLSTRGMRERDNRPVSAVVTLPMVQFAAVKGVFSHWQPATINWETAMVGDDLRDVAYRDFLTRLVTKAKDEGPQEYFHRLMTVYHNHSGMTKPDPYPGPETTPYETLLKQQFIQGLQHPLGQLVKDSCIGWSDADTRLSRVVKHADHQYKRQQEKKTATDDEDTVTVTALNGSNVPHVSLARSHKDEWKDIGPWTRLCEEATDWEQTHDPKVLFSPSLHVYCTDWSTAVPATPTVLVIQENTIQTLEASEGIQPVFDSLLAAGVIVPCPNSPVNSPILPVKKYRPPPAPEEWRFVQDLTAVNAAVQSRAPLVPNLYTILSTIPSNATWFSVIELSNAFFSVPVHPDSQYWFAFQFRQGATHSLECHKATDGSALLQYIDDLLLCAPTRTQCVQDTVTLLTRLAKEGHKVSRTKMQYAQQIVTFLGHKISRDGKALVFVPNFSKVVKPSNVLSRSIPMGAKIQWTPEPLAAFTYLKLTLQTPPTLGIPYPDRPFTQTVDERQGCMTSVLLQEHGGSLRPVAYSSLAAAEKAVVASRDLVTYSLLVPHMVTAILHEQRTSHLSAAREHTRGCSGKGSGCSPSTVTHHIRGQVKAALPTPAEELHNLKPGDYVVLKDFRRTRWNQKRWQGPFQILLVTQTAVKVAERATWIHASHCKRVPEPKEPVSRETQATVKSGAPTAIVEWDLLGGASVTGENCQLLRMGDTFSCHVQNLVTTPL